MVSTRLNALAGEGLQLGVMWYLNSVQESNADGRFTAYANLKSCDQALYEKLSRIIPTSDRNLSEVEKREILPSETLFYREALPFPRRSCSNISSRAHQQKSREDWFSEGFQKLKPANLVFLDPDNGLASKTVHKHGGKSVKYVFLDEITCWLQRRQSVVLYQHQRRQALATQVAEQLREFDENGHSGWALSFHRRSVRIYFVLPCPEHREQMRERSMALVDGRWGREGHFRLHLPDPGR